MYVHVPPEISSERLRQNAGGPRLRHHDMMLESLFAHVLHQFLQARDLGDSAIAESVERVVR